MKTKKENNVFVEQIKSIGNKIINTLTKEWRDIKLDIRTLILIAIFLSMGLILSFLKSVLPDFMFGFDINLEFIILIVFCSFNNIFINMIFTLIFWILYPLASQEKWIIVNQYSWVLEYGVPYFATIFFGLFRNVKLFKKRLLCIEAYIIVIYLIKFFCHSWAGILFWGMKSWIPSAAFNIPYVFSNLIFILLIIPPILLGFEKHNLLTRFFQQKKW